MVLQTDGQPNMEGTPIYDSDGAVAMFYIGIAAYYQFHGIAQTQTKLRIARWQVAE
jgi:hypothetical protein